MADLKKITTRQLIIFYCIYSFSIKFLSFPQILAQGAGNAAWITAAIGTLIELALLFLVLNVLVMGKNSDIYSDLRNNTKWIGAKFIILLMFCVFLLQLFILLTQSFILIRINLFNDMNIHIFLVPLMLFGILFCFVPARAIFRSGEIFYLLIILGLALAVFPALWKMNFSDLSPVFNKGVDSVFNSVYLNLIYFESAAFLLVFSGDIKIDKNFRKKFMTTASILGLFFVFFVFMCITVFGPLAPTKPVAIANLTLYSNFLTQSGRLDWVLVCIWLMLLLLRFGATFYASFACVRYLFNVKHRAGYIGFGIATVLYLVYIFAVGDKTTLDSFIRTAAPGIAVLFFVIPIACFVNALVNKRRFKTGSLESKGGKT